MCQIHDRMQKGKKLMVEGCLDEAIHHFESLLADLLEMTAAESSCPPEVLEVAGDLTTLLHWKSLYPEAAALQERLCTALPQYVEAFRENAAILQVAYGDAVAGLQTLEQMVERSPEDVWCWINLGQSFLWLEDFAAAEKCFERAASLGPPDSAERAWAQRCLFFLYGKLGKVEEAEKAWELAAQLEPDNRPSLPDLIRVFLQWFYYDRVLQLSSQDGCVERQLFYTNLVAVKRGEMGPEQAWGWAMQLAPGSLTGGEEEVSEAALRYVRPFRALEILEPLIDQGVTRPRIYVLAGLAWAQARMLARSQWAFEMAVRLGNLVKPCLTREGRGDRRCLDVAARALYEEIILDADIRVTLDRYFLPLWEKPDPGVPQAAASRGVSEQWSDLL
jgi:tetratricopeptide (TPR) repeat protein